MPSFVVTIQNKSFVKKLVQCTNNCVDFGKTQYVYMYIHALFEWLNCLHSFFLYLSFMLNTGTNFRDDRLAQNGSAVFFIYIPSKHGNKVNIQFAL